ncbi:MAG TPA: hypothetical protein VHC18_28890 [Amycolatopsis sp.]|nr:hypothetical protein [Amycolatopsis sp.]
MLDHRRGWRLSQDHRSWWWGMHWCRVLPPPRALPAALWDDPAVVAVPQGRTRA